MIRPLNTFGRDIATDIPPNGTLHIRLYGERDSRSEKRRIGGLFPENARD